MKHLQMEWSTVDRYLLEIVRPIRNGVLGSGDVQIFTQGMLRKILFNETFIKRGSKDARRGCLKVFETKDMVVVTMCTDDEISSLSFKRIQWLPIISRDWISLDVVFQIAIIVLVLVTTSTACIGYHDEARVIIYLDIDEWMLFVLVVLVYDEGGSVQTRASEVLVETRIGSHRYHAAGGGAKGRIICTWSRATARVIKMLYALCLKKLWSNTLTLVSVSTEVGIREVAALSFSCTISIFT